MKVKGAGYGQCKDCIWYKVKEGCNVERGSSACLLNIDLRKKRRNYGIFSATKKVY